MFQTLLLFLGYPAKKYVAGDVHAAQASSPHRVSNGQRRTRQLPKVKRKSERQQCPAVCPCDTSFQPYRIATRLLCFLCNEDHLPRAFRLERASAPVSEHIPNHQSRTGDQVQHMFP